MTAQTEALDALIEAVERGEHVNRKSWSTVFIHMGVLDYLQDAQYGSLDAARALRDALGVHTPIDIDARKWLLGILRDYRAKIGGEI